MRRIKTWTSTIVLSLGLLSSAMAGEQVLLQVDFEEANIGGTITPVSSAQPKGADSTGVVPAHGVFGTFKNDAAAIVAPGLDGSGKALRAFDQVKSRGLRFDLLLDKPLTRGRAAVRFDVKVAPSVSSDNVLFVNLLAGSDIFCSVNFRASDKGLYATHDAQKVSRFPEGFIGPPDYPNGVLLLGEALRYELQVDLDAMKYDLLIKRLADGAEFYNGKARTMVSTPALAQQGFSMLRVSFGAPDFAEGSGGEERYVDLDNIVVSIPTP